MVVTRILQLFRERIEKIDSLWWIILCCLIVIEIIIVMSNRRSQSPRRAILRSVFITYLLFILVATVFNRKSIPSEYSLVSFDISTAWTFGPGIYGPIDTITEFAMNILMFVPFGFLIAMLTNRKPLIVFAVCFLITVTIEILQLLTRRGFFELADIILNMVGAIIGYCLCRFNNLRNRE